MEFNKSLKRSLMSHTQRMNDKKLRWIWIGNVEVEEYWKDEETLSLPGDKINTSRYLVNRMGEMSLFLADSDDIVCLKDNVDQDYLNYVKKFRGDLPHIYVCQSSDENKNVTQSLLEEVELFSKILDKDYQYMILPYGSSKFEEELAEKIGAKLASPLVSVCKKVNSKTYSRNLSGQVGIRQVEGATVDTLKELEDQFHQLKYLLDEGPLVLKDALGVSGKGMVLIDSEKKFNGIFKMLQRSSKKKGHDQTQFILETWMGKKKDLNYQILIDENGNSKLVSIKEAIVQNGVHSGHLQPVSLNNKQREDLEVAVEKIGKKLFQDGFFGIAGVDGFIGNDDHLYPCLEINARFNMATYQNRILEQWVESNATIMACPININVTEHINFSSVKQALHDYLYFPSSESGVIVHSFSTLQKAWNGSSRNGRLYTVLVGKNKEECILLSQKVEEVLSQLFKGIEEEYFQTLK
ncbi:ATP-grasp domain-containing protein [Priestia koreensis]|uniref:ATP-binding protein n=1 Tax=Priestia koreensis TaxID=284581 RepID=UPI003D07E502